MRRFGICSLMLCGMVLIVNPVSAQQRLEKAVDTLVNGCKPELEKYCSNVTIGHGRVLACLYAYNDKLSGRCEYALHDAAVPLQRAVGALSYVANECSSDLKKHCAGVEAGEGRLLECLQKNDAQVSNRCKQARKEVGLK